jgi:nucleoside-triphosphatase THEP1
VVARTCLVTGPVQSGKTTFLDQLVRLLLKSGIRVSGILAPGAFSGNQRDHIRILDIESGTSVAMAQREEVLGWIPFRGYFFNPEAFSFGERILHNAFERQSEVIILDEVGPMEMEGLGWRKALDELEQRKEGILVCSVRKASVDRVRSHLILPDYQEFDIQQNTPPEVSRRIKGWVKK